MGAGQSRIRGDVELARRYCEGVGRSGKRRQHGRVSSWCVAWRGVVGVWVAGYSFMGVSGGFWRPEAYLSRFSGAVW